MRTEREIINQAFFLIEQDNDVWEVDSDEYEVARGLLNNGITRWETYENTNWRELLKKNSDSDGDQVLTDSYSYRCASDFVYPGTWVRTGTREWEVIKPEKVGMYANSKLDWCYFSGNEKSGFTLNFNPNVTLTEGDAIEYEYFKKADTTSDPDDEVEMSDPYFLAYFIGAHLGEDGMNLQFFNIAEARLDTMRTKNMSGYIGVPDMIDDMSDYGFGL